MKKVRRFAALIVLILVASGCTTNGVYDSGKTWSLVTVVAVGAVAASAGGSSAEEDCGFSVGPGGTSTRFCN